MSCTLCLQGRKALEEGKQQPSEHEAEQIQIRETHATPEPEPLNSQESPSRAAVLSLADGTPVLDAVSEQMTALRPQPTSERAAVDSGETEKQQAAALTQPAEIEVREAIEADVQKESGNAAPSQILEVPEEKAANKIAKETSTAEIASEPGALIQAGGRISLVISAPQVLTSEHNSSRNRAVPKALPRIYSSLSTHCCLKSASHSMSHDITFSVNCDTFMLMRETCLKILLPAETT